MNDADSVNDSRRIVSTPGICGGRPRIRDTRVRVIDIIDLLASGMREDDIVRDYPYVTREDIHACRPNSEKIVAVVRGVVR